MSPCRGFTLKYVRAFRYSWITAVIGPLSSAWSQRAFNGHYFGIIAILCLIFQLSSSTGRWRLPESLWTPLSEKREEARLCLSENTLWKRNSTTLQRNWGWGSRKDVRQAGHGRLLCPEKRSDQQTLSWKPANRQSAIYTRRLLC